MGRPTSIKKNQLIFFDLQDSFVPPLSIHFCIVFISSFLIVFRNKLQRDAKVRGQAVIFKIWPGSCMPCHPIILFLFVKDENYQLKLEPDWCHTSLRCSWSMQITRAISCHGNKWDMAFIFVLAASWLRNFKKEKKKYEGAAETSKHWPNSCPDQCRKPRMMVS